MTNESKSDFVSGVIEKNLNKIIGWVVAALLAGIIAVPVMKYQIDQLREKQAIIDHDLDTATRALVILTNSVDLKPMPRETGLMGGGYDRKGALDDVLGKLEQRVEPALLPKGDDDDSAWGDDDDSAKPSVPPVLLVPPVVPVTPIAPAP